MFERSLGCSHPRPQEGEREHMPSTEGGWVGREMPGVLIHTLFLFVSVFSAESEDEGGMLDV